MPGKIGMINLVTLVNRNVVWRPVYTLLHGIIPKRVISRFAYVIRPNEESTQFSQYSIDRILPSWLSFRERPRRFRGIGRRRCIHCEGTPRCPVTPTASRYQNRA